MPLTNPPAGSSGASAWGDITGTLSNQTDLQTALDGKSATGHTHANDHARSHSITSASDHSFPGGTSTFLRADGTFASPPAGGGEAFPVGSVFLSVVSTNPATLLGYGTWQSIGAGRVLIGLDAGDPAFDTLEETGGAKTVASAGTNSAPTFTGSPLGNHAHELPFQLVSGTSVRHLPAATFGTGTSRAAQGADTATANTTSAAVALSQSVSAGTPAGTVSAPTFTGSATSVVQPYLVIAMWKRTA